MSVLEAGHSADSVVSLDSRTHGVWHSLLWVCVSPVPCGPFVERRTCRVPGGGDRVLPRFSVRQVVCWAAFAALKNTW